MTEEKRAKPKDYRKTLRGLLAYLRREWIMLLFAFSLILVSNVLALWGPQLSGQAIDAMGGNSGQLNIPLTVQKALLMLAAYSGAAILNYAVTRLVVRLSQRVVKRMRQDTFNKIVELPLAYIDTRQTGDLVSRISYDLDVVSQSLTHDIIQIGASVITVVGSLIMMIRLSLDLSLVFLLIVPATIVFTIYRIRKTRPLFRKRSKKLGEMNGYVEEILYGQKTIRAYNQEEHFASEFRVRNIDSMDAYFKADYQASMNGPSVTLISNISLALVSMFGALLFIAGRFSLGNLTAFILYSRRFSGPINEVAALIAELQSALSAAERVFTLLAEPAEPADKDGALDLTDVKGEVEFDQVSFAYEPGKPVIRNLNLKAKAQSLTAVVGPTGAGKTTLVNLLMRFYDPQAGEIRIDGYPIQDVTRSSLRQSFAMVLQDTWLFQGSIRDNIAYGKPEASLEDVKRAARAAHIDAFIEAQPNGYDTIISDGATNLSQGQKQLLTIARAMLLDSPLLILDEATSNVDSRTEIKIQDAMNKLIEGRTSFVIAHRLSTIQNADTILLVSDGEIIEQGTHAELLANKGAYEDLYRAQFA
ncbi:MAG TPA: ABC transporter ATP-binding protein [Clostridiaceae bacterium]|nr:ABC transporter ATP-binding protein [Clostridiaceae bacterium]